ncbi:hypothetical protein NKCBBBOE_02314 [Pseudarthrobacter sp. MM222]|nr:hypothetical protein NKCBBBOE_02314 [Pseudarthrobacter sp. MM222]
MMQSRSTRLVAGKGFGKGLIVLGFDKLVNETAGEDVHNTETLLSRRCAPIARVWMVA